MSLPRLCTMQGPGTAAPAPAGGADDERSRRICAVRRAAERHIALARSAGSPLGQAGSPAPPQMLGRRVRDGGGGGSPELVGEILKGGASPCVRAPAVRTGPQERRPPVAAGWPGALPGGGAMRCDAMRCGAHASAGSWNARGSRPGGAQKSEGEFGYDVTMVQLGGVQACSHELAVQYEQQYVSVLASTDHGIGFAVTTESILHVSLTLELCAWATAAGESELDGRDRACGGKSTHTIVRQRSRGTRCCLGLTLTRRNGSATYAWAKHHHQGPFVQNGSTKNPPDLTQRCAFRHAFHPAEFFSVIRFDPA
nr:unnamed protein product [Digitaria exilis]